MLPYSELKKREIWIVKESHSFHSDRQTLVDDMHPRPSPSHCRCPPGHGHYACSREMTAETSREEDCVPIVLLLPFFWIWLSVSAARTYVRPMCYRGLQGDRSNNVYLLDELNPIINSIKCTRELPRKLDCFRDIDAFFNL